MPSRMFGLIWLVILLQGCGAGAAHTALLDRHTPQSDSPPRAAAGTPRPEPAALCARLAEISATPFHDEPVDDEVYKGLVLAGKAAVPCLIERLEDEAGMRDPRPTPKYRDFKVGDMAHFMLLRITRVPFEQMLPEEVSRRLEDEGVYAYFEFVERPENRRLLKDRWREWAARNL